MATKRGSWITGCRLTSNELSPEQIVRRWRLLRWWEEPVAGAPRLHADFDVVKSAYLCAGATQADLYDALLGRRASALAGLTGRKLDDADRTFLETRPETAEMIDRSRARILEIELARGDAPTVATPLAWATPVAVVDRNPGADPDGPWKSRFQKAVALPLWRATREPCRNSIASGQHRLSANRRNSGAIRGGDENRCCGGAFSRTPPSGAGVSRAAMVAVHRALFSMAGIHRRPLLVSGAHALRLRGNRQGHGRHRGGSRGRKRRKRRRGSPAIGLGTPDPGAHPAFGRRPPGRGHRRGLVSPHV